MPTSSSSPEVLLVSGEEENLRVIKSMHVPASCWHGEADYLLLMFLDSIGQLGIWNTLNLHNDPLCNLKYVFISLRDIDSGIESDTGSDQMRQVTGRHDKERIYF